MPPLILDAPSELTEDAIIVRQSTIGSMELCPARVGYEMQGLSIQPTGDAITFGQVVHSLCEDHLLNGPQPVQPKHLDERIERILVEQYDWDISRVKNYKQYRRNVVEAYRLWTFQVYEHFLADEIKGNRRFYVEQDLYWRFSDRVWGRGTPDLATKYSMWDFKTTNAAFKWNQEKADTNFQATYYLALHNLTFGKDWQLDKFRFVVYDRKNNDWNVLDTSRTKEQMASALLIAEQYGYQIQAGVFPATPFKEEYGKVKQGWYCSAKWCGAWNACAYKGIGQRDTSEEAVREWT